MTKNRRNFIKKATAAGIGAATIPN
ncbi:MAG: twin-arginine translocation signal domain-containing protein, partial [Cellulophaga sp.]